MSTALDTLRSSHIKEALDLLGIRNFLLGIHDAAFPSLPEEDIGRGSPYSQGALQFLRFARELGFNGIQFGPQGITTPINPSPYDGTVFSRNPLSLSLHQLSRPPWNLLQAERAAYLVGRQNLDFDRVEEEHARLVIDRISAEVCRGFRLADNGAGLSAELRRAYARFCADNGDWLEPDGLYAILRHYYGVRTWKEWGEDGSADLDKRLFAPPPGGEEAASRRLNELRNLYRPELEEYSFIQFLLHEQHRELREQCGLLGLKLFCDCQIGLSDSDAWYAQSFLLPGYLMGAPPSRTNPDGQPWNYPVLDPRRYHLIDRDGSRQAGAALRFFRRRVDRLFTEFDGMRVDHPHGLICPWVYRDDQPDAIAAVQAGARLFASPGLDDHPALAAFAIPGKDQIDLRLARYDDHWVTSLDDQQVRRYAGLMEQIMESAGENCRTGCEIACEILSTQPYPLQRVMALYGFGRFRVTQKADLANPLDGYRTENARSEDWLMLGNHDTPSIWQVTDRWVRSGESRRQAEYLAARLAIGEEEREQWIARVAGNAGALAQAKFADLFVGPARNIMVFFTDLLGIDRPYNVPGTVSRENWTLRVHPEYRGRYAQRVQHLEVLDIAKALALALRARGVTDGAGQLVRALEYPE